MVTFKRRPDGGGSVSADRQLREASPPSLCAATHLANGTFAQEPDGSFECIDPLWADVVTV